MFIHRSYDQKMTNFFVGYLTYFLWAANEGISIRSFIEIVEWVARYSPPFELICHVPFLGISTNPAHLICCRTQFILLSNMVVEPPLVGIFKSAEVSLKYFASSTFILLLVIGESLFKISNYGYKKSLWEGNGAPEEVNTGALFVLFFAITILFKNALL